MRMPSGPVPFGVAMVAIAVMLSPPLSGAPWS